MTSSDNVDEKSGHRRHRRSATVAAVAIGSGYRYAVFNLQILKNRVSMPLLRSTISNEIKRARASAELEFCSNELLIRSILAHRFLLIFFSLLSFYSLFVCTRAAAALIKFNEPTSWLIEGPLLLLICAMRLLVSYRSVRAQQRELSRRKLEINT
jgi:hypothetical protein